jgi:protoheme IX farnesyltransferase
MKKALGASAEAIGPPGRALSFASLESHRLSGFVSLTKPRLNFLVVLTAAVGYYLGSGSDLDLVTMAAAIGGTALVAGGAAGLNQVYERETDQLMDRTRSRPLPARRLTRTEATVFSLVLAGAGLAILTASTNLLAGLLALLTLISYNVVYTPLKRRSSLATLVGAVPGALPPAIGWTAAHGSLTAGAAALFAIVFTWQIPHFMAIAWLYRDDFGRAGFPLLPVLQPDGRSTARQAIAFSAILIPISLAPFFLQLAGAVYAVGALAGGLCLFGCSIAFGAVRSTERARRLFVASIMYLPLLWVLLIADRV